ncbi:unnamed protein product [Pieris macdunnoughi]|uniref:Uncharacterized protein n=1 Tax=Pieris macdunnoughi TaxID=345717 RepID=A0A821P199_9NEOP|nr:unnamed protein product [Pieris macdunnoughi]
MMPHYLKSHAITHLLIKEPLPPGAILPDAFHLLIDDDLLDLIVRETNSNAVRVGVADNVKRNSQINN